jgi:hypothetical protein
MADAIEIYTHSVEGIDGILEAFTLLKSRNACLETYYIGG